MYAFAAARICQVAPPGGGMHFAVGAGTTHLHIEDDAQIKVRRGAGLWRSQRKEHVASAVLFHVHVESCHGCRLAYQLAAGQMHLTLLEVTATCSDQRHRYAKTQCVPQPGG